VIAVAAIPQARVADSWETFVQALADESAALGGIQRAALAMTTVLIAGTPVQIHASERALEASRVIYAKAAGARRAMQVRGFGQKTLRQVCAYAPRRIAGAINQRMSELATYSIGIRISSSNNKALITSGMERLVKVTGALQKATSDGPGTYRRRGIVAPPRNSVLVSSRA
jgi:glycine/D-amino acid oxidase-like deaminating enzyme